MALHSDRAHMHQRNGPFGLLDLPREVIRRICLHIYNPMELTQQDRLTWGIFSTVDMNAQRQSDLSSLIQFGAVCRKVRKEARVVLFRCIRVGELRWLNEVVENRDDWGKYVRSIIIDLNMFDPDPDTFPHPLVQPSTSYTPILSRTPRSCWSESALLVELVRSLPSLEHLCIFADASDDSALALFFSSLITHPSLHAPPAPTQPPTPLLHATTSTPTPIPTPIPFASRLISFGWRQRAAPPPGFRTYAQVSTFVSTLHLIRHAHRLSYLVLDADMDEMDPEDILTVLRELDKRPPPEGEESERVSLTLCGPIRGWEGGFLGRMVGEYKGLKELFVDRPLRKSHEGHMTSVGNFVNLLSPLSQLPYLHLLQVGSYTWTPSAQLEILSALVHVLPKLLVLGVLNQQYQTSWWGIWRDRGPNGFGGRDSLQGRLPEGGVQVGEGIWGVPLAEGHLGWLEREMGVEPPRVGMGVVEEMKDGEDVVME